MNAIVLAAGHGTRLGALGERVAKVLVDVGGEPLLARQLRYLARQGFDRVVINAHHLAHQIEAFIDAYEGPLELACSRETQLLGTAGGVRNALALLGPDAFGVFYGDVLIEEPIAPLLSTHRRSSAVATLGVYAAADAVGKGVVELAGDERVTAFAEKPSNTAPPFFVNAGVYVIEPALLSALPPGTPADFGHDVFPEALARGARIVAHVLSEPVVDIGTPDALALARERVAAASTRHPAATSQ